MLVVACRIENSNQGPIFDTQNIEGNDFTYDYIQIFVPETASSEQSKDKNPLESWPNRLISLPHFFDGKYVYTAYVQTSQTPYQKKLLISNFSFFLVDYNLSDCMQFSVKL